MALYALSQVAQGFIALGIVGGIARALGPIGFGEYSFSFVLATLASLIADFGFGPWVTRAVAQAPGQRREILRAVFWLRHRLVVLAAVAVVAAAMPFGGGSGRLPGISLLFLYTTLLGYSAILEGQLMGLRRIGRITFATLVGRSLELLGVLAALRFGWLGSVGDVALALLPGAGLRLLLLFAWTRAPEPTDRSAGETGATLGFGTCGQMTSELLPFAVAAALWMAYVKVDVLILERMGTPAGLGLYTAAARLIEALSLVPRSVAAVFYPIFSAAWARGRLDLELLSRPLRPLLVLAFGMAGGLWAISGEALHFLFGDGFEAGFDALRILAVGIVPLFLNQYLGMVFTTSHRQGEWTSYLAIGLLLNVIANLVLVPRVGYAGAAWAKLASEAGLSILFGFILTRRHGILLRPQWILLLCLAAGGMTAFVAWLQEPLFVRIVAGGLVFGVLISLLGVMSREEWRLAGRSFLEGLPRPRPWA
jgi:O-antigen/teichoic acid export membrane protein